MNKKTPPTTHAADAQARAERELELLEAEVAATRQRLDELRRKQGELRAATTGRQPHSAWPTSPPGWERCTHPTRSPACS